MQELAYDARLSGLLDDELDALASIASYGQTNKAHRDLSRRYCTDLSTPQPLVLQIPAVDPKGDHSRSILVETTIFLPSQWLVALQDDQLEYEFSALFGIDRLQEFWSHQSNTNDPKWKEHSKLFSQPPSNIKAIPILLHGDGARFENRDSLMTISFIGVLKEGSTLETNVILAAWPKSCCAKQEGELGTLSGNG